MVGRARSRPSRRARSGPRREEDEGHEAEEGDPGEDKESSSGNDGAETPDEPPKFARPRGAAPTGKSWDYSRGEWVTRPHFKLVETVSELLKTIHADASQKRPRGAPPSGMVWDYANCVWTDEGQYVKDLLARGSGYVDELREAAERAKKDAALINDAQRAKARGQKRNGAANGQRRGRGRPRLAAPSKSATKNRREKRPTATHPLPSSSRRRTPAPQPRRQEPGRATSSKSGPPRKSRSARVVVHPSPVLNAEPGSAAIAHIEPSGSSLVDELRELEDRILLEERLFLEGDQRISSGNVVLGWPGLAARFDSWAGVYGLGPSDGAGSPAATHPASPERVASIFSARNVTNLHLKRALLGQSEPRETSKPKGSKKRRRY